MHTKHETVYNHLKDSILQSEFKPGEKLPSESRLGEYFRVSRVTVRHALSELEKDGFITKKQGLGAFVNEPRMNPNLVRLTDFIEDTRQAGFNGTSDILSMDETIVPRSVASILDLEEQTKVLKIERIRKADDKPIAFDITWLPLFYGQLLINQNLVSNTIYNILETKFDIPILSGRYRITAITAGPKLAKYLHIEPNSALLEIDRCSKTVGDKKVYYQRRFYNPVNVSYELELSRKLNDHHSLKDGLPLMEFVPKFTK